MVDFITYENKETLNENPDILNKYKCNASDLNEIKEVINNTIVDTLYPINIIVPFYDSADHSSWLGLTWERIGTGKTLVGYDSSDTDFNTIGKTGGEKEHTLTKSELPKIDISTKFANPSTTSYGTGLQHGTYSGSSTNDLVSNINFGGNAHNNLQPYEVVSFWKRVS